MISYVIGLVAVLVFFADPVARFISPSGAGAGGRARMVRTPRPQMNESLLAIEHPNATALSCPPDAYSVRIFSKEPLVLYIEGFLSSGERAHLLDIRYGGFTSALLFLLFLPNPNDEHASPTHIRLVSSVPGPP